VQRETMTTLLDALGLVLVAVGAGLMAMGAFMALASEPGTKLAVATGIGVAVSGAVTVTGSAFAQRQDKPEQPTEPEGDGI
jgi:membrane protein implicated in regulation of membrane protease activity